MRKLVALILVITLCGCSNLDMGIPYKTASLDGPSKAEVRRAMDAYASTHPVCEACGATDHLETHHIHPQLTHPHLAADTNNMIRLCRGRNGGHHLWLGHGDANTKHYNVNVRQAARLTREGMVR